MRLCAECFRETNNPKFCSQSCSAIYNNQRRPKKPKKPQKLCEDCGIVIDGRSKRCRRCCPSFGELTLDGAIYSKHHRSSAFALIRTRARAQAKKLGLDTCQFCGYDKHVEIAHIKGISTFTGDTLVSVINGEDNLMALCPNCHWEFDNLPA
jgi:hypothetical protein